MWVPLPCVSYIFSFDTPNSYCRASSIVWGLYTSPFLVDVLIYSHSSNMWVSFPHIHYQYLLLFYFIFLHWITIILSWMWQECAFDIFMSFMTREPAPVHKSVDIFSGLCCEKCLLTSFAQFESNQNCLLLFEFLPHFLCDSSFAFSPLRWTWCKAFSGWCTHNGPFCFCTCVFDILSPVFIT